MLNSVDFSGRPFHFIGIGGIGMSALAYILAKRSLPVSGSDICLNHITQRLQQEGVHIFLSQEAANLEFFKSNAYLSRLAQKLSAPGNANSDTQTLEQSSLLHSSCVKSDMLPQVVCSTAINPANSEYSAAVELGCPILHRSDVLAALIQDYASIAVAGTHGKTTTSSMIGCMLVESGLDPTIVIGGEVSVWEGNARLGYGPHLVAEADESDGSLVKFAAQIGIITNIELDHPDHYASLQEVVETFKVFAQRCRTLIGCADCEVVRKQFQPEITYSLDSQSGADYTVKSVKYGAYGTIAEIWERGSLLGILSLDVLGHHNLSNALAAVAVGRLAGLEFGQIALSLGHFKGARRRFECRGEHHDILFVDDYAHHPSEIRATLSAARLRAAEFRQGRVVAVFQPHRYSRTQTFLEDFGQAFDNADLVVTTDIYSAGEQRSELISGQQVAEAIAAHHSNVFYRATLAALTSFLSESLRPGDVVLFLGAGNLNQIIPELMDFYQKIEKGEIQAIV
jgi:UDP-N-acetylmuramate--alanine ligase